ncbi:hypothetical protein BC937DRAFT_92169 [Endogone sp. FLAS-F59071]|nr:hypothetical protein BC937DRAFT_92169 [Endogone sp. FLAS-F59071]|eukprot:RUS15662.1 hypothetical protein BC937DRAFT_92169 [Endogone sp. FLAS-F59071]
MISWSVNEGFEVRIVLAGYRVGSTFAVLAPASETQSDKNTRIYTIKTIPCHFFNTPPNTYINFLDSHDALSLIHRLLAPYSLSVPSQPPPHVSSPLRLNLPRHLRSPYPTPPLKASSATPRVSILKFPRGSS